MPVCYIESVGVQGHEEVDERACKGKTVVEYYLNKNTVLCLLVFYCSFVMRWVEVQYFISDFFAIIYDSI